MLKQSFNLNKVICFLLFIFLCLPLFEDNLDFFKYKPLIGVTNETINKPSFSLRLWLKGQYPNGEAVAMSR